MSPDGDIIDSSFSPASDTLTLSMYENMLSVSIMDVIMFDAQRQGRLSFYMTSQGEEGTCVGSASALEKEDVIFCQYRETGVFAQRGYTFDDFMSQLFANKKDTGRGRNMPVHYGSTALNIVSSTLSLKLPYTNKLSAHHFLPSCDSNSTSSRRSVRLKNATAHRSKHASSNSSVLLRRRCGK
jgi:2-oxoisovalerate dehydrogenase E1 component alpha subunit